MDARTALVRTVSVQLASTLIALDFDGTLAPLVDDPSHSRLVDGAAPILSALARAGAHVVLVTGRDAATVLRLSGLEALPGLQVHGLYGAEHWQAGELATRPDPPAFVSARTFLDELIATEPDPGGVWVEDKRLSLVVHARTARDPDAILASMGPAVEDFAAGAGLEVHPGRNVLELRLPGFDKGRVVRRLVDQLAPDAVIYAGDDVGDLPAFAAVGAVRAAGRAAWSIAVGDPPLPRVSAAADIVLDSAADLVGLLAELLS